MEDIDDIAQIEISDENKKIQLVDKLPKDKPDDNPKDKPAKSKVTPIADIQPVSDDEIEEIPNPPTEKKALPLLDACRPEVQTKFFQKLYSILSLQFSLMMGLFITSVNSPEYQKFIFDHGIFYFFCWIISIFLMILLYYRKKLKYRYPHNLILLAFLTLTLSYCISALGATASPYEAYASLVTIYLYLLIIAFITHYAKKPFNVSSLLMLFVFIALCTFSTFATITRGKNLGYMIVAMTLTALFCIAMSAYIQYIIVGDCRENDLIPATISVYTGVIAFIANLGSGLYEVVEDKCSCCS